LSNSISYFGVTIETLRDFDVAVATAYSLADDAVDLAMLLVISPADVTLIAVDI